MREGRHLEVVPELLPRLTRHVARSEEWAEALDALHEPPQVISPRSPAAMHLCVCGRENLDELQRIVLDRFKLLRQGEANRRSSYGTRPIVSSEIE